MKADQITKCCGCGKGVAHTGLSIFFQLKVQRFGFDRKAVQRRHGLEEFFGGGQGGAVLAHVMGADEDLAKQLEDEQRSLVCMDCALKPIPLAQMLEQIIERQEGRKDDAARA